MTHQHQQRVKVTGIHSVFCRGCFLFCFHIEFWVLQCYISIAFDKMFASNFPNGVSIPFDIINGRRHASKLTANIPIWGSQNWSTKYVKRNMYHIVLHGLPRKRLERLKWQRKKLHHCYCTNTQYTTLNSHHHHHHQRHFKIYFPIHWWWRCSVACHWHTPSVVYEPLSICCMAKWRKYIYECGSRGI